MDSKNIDSAEMILESPDGTWWGPSDWSKDGKKILIQNQAGEGFSSQNSATQSIGIPVGDSIAKLEIRWPSGNNTTVVAPNETEICVISEVAPAAN